MKVKEKAITQGIRGLINSLGIFHWKNHGGPMGAKGVSDILGCYQCKKCHNWVHSNENKENEYLS
jgi:hypothetical protein